MRTTCAPLRSDRARGVRAVPIEAQRIDAVTRYVAEHTSPEEPIFVVPWAAGFYFLADRENPTRIDFMLFEDPEAYPCLIARLEQQPPKYVIYGYTWDVDERRFRDYAAPIDRYIRSRYAIESGVDGYEIWRRLEGVNAADDQFDQACQPRRFRWRDLFASPIERDSTKSSVLPNRHALCNNSRVVSTANGLVTQAYDRLARVYDLLFGAILQPGRERAVRAIQSKPGLRVLELGIGTGLTAPLYSRDWTVVGVDLSPAMLTQAQKAHHRARSQPDGHVARSRWRAVAVRRRKLSTWCWCRM